MSYMKNSIILFVILLLSTPSNGHGPSRQKVSERKFNRTQYKVKRLKTISGVIHAVIAEINDENSEILVALSVLEDKNKFKLL